MLTADRFDAEGKQLSDGRAIRALIRAELQNDPAARGYAGKNPSEQADLLNTNPDADTPPRISTILLGVPYTPNAVDADDVTTALGE